MDKMFKLEIKEIKELKKISLCDFKKIKNCSLGSGIYFLFFNDKLLYVGRTANNLDRRIRQHLTYNNTCGHIPLKQKITHVAFISLKKNKNFLSFYENFYIYLYNPTYNNSKKNHRDNTSKKKQILMSQQKVKKMCVWLDENSHNKGYSLAVEIGYECALRISEIVAIKKQDFDTEKFMEELNDTGKRIPCELKITAGKGNKERVVLVPFKLFYKITKFMEDLEETENIFSFGVKSLWKNFNLACKNLQYVSTKNGKNLFTPNTLRHSKATKWLEDGENIVTIKNLLGHSSIATTQIYLNLEKQKALLDRKIKMVQKEYE